MPRQGSSGPSTFTKDLAAAPGPFAPGAERARNDISFPLSQSLPASSSELLWDTSAEPVEHVAPRAPLASDIDDHALALRIGQGQGERQVRRRVAARLELFRQAVEHPR